MMKKALLCVSFGTSAAGARESITAVEERLRAAAPDRMFVRAFTSPTIRRILAGRGEEVPSLAQALEILCRQGVTDVLVQPTHMLYGREYEKIRADVAPWRERFETFRLGVPLLAGAEDLRKLARILSGRYPPQEGEALVLFGHGTDHSADMAYPALQTVFRLQGRPDVLVGTVEGWPDLAEVLAQLRDRGGSRVRLVPLMLVAGDHVRNDMAGKGPDSWTSRLEAAGYAVRCTMQGLGMLPEVQALYAEHLRAALQRQEKDHGL